MAHQAIVMDERDSVAVAVADLSAGSSCTVLVGDTLREVELRERIPFGHKVALRRIPAGEGVLKYGEVIGETTVDVEPGSWVHVHNVICRRGRGAQPEEVAR